jgi:hypothetical protein
MTASPVTNNLREFAASNSARRRENGLRAEKQTAHTAQRKVAATATSTQGVGTL